MLEGGLLDGMALGAERQFVGCLQLCAKRPGRFDGMTGDTGEVSHLVRATMPEETLPFAVALQTDSVLTCDGLQGIGTKPDILGRICGVFNVLAPGTMAGFTAMLLKSGAGYGSS